MDHAAAGVRGTDRGAQRGVVAQTRADREAAASAAARHLTQRGPPQPAPRREQRQSLEHVGLARSVVADQQVEPRGAVDRGRGVVAEVFEKAMQSAPSVLVIDEMEAFLADRDSGGGGSNHRVEEVAEFLRRIPEATKNEVLVIAMTNKIEMIDQAIMRRGRFDHVIKVDFASEKEVLDLLIKLLETLPKDDSVEPVALAKRLAGRPLSDVTFVVREGARLCARTGKDRLEQELLIQALDGTPSRSDEGQSNRIGFV